MDTPGETGQSRRRIYKTLFQNTPEPPKIHFNGVKVYLMGWTDKIEIRRKYKAWIKDYKKSRLQRTEPEQTAGERYFSFSSANTFDISRNAFSICFNATDLKKDLSKASGILSFGVSAERARSK